MLAFNSIRKYTLALLETFNDLKVEYSVMEDGVQQFKYKKIPIKYSSREKINLFDEVEEKQLLSGNYNMLPRASLALSTTVKNAERQPNKFNKIATTDFGEFIFNAVSYDFSFEMAIMCRGMNEASAVMEQIAVRFNPTYTVRINEIPNQIEPTSVPIQLLDLSLEPVEYDELSTNIVTVNVGMMLKGNFYTPVQELAKIHNVQMYLNMWHHSDKNEYNRAKLYEFDVEDNIMQPDPETFDLVDTEGQFGNVIPVISDIECEDTVVTDEELVMKCISTDKDNKLDELDFVWTVSGSAMIIDQRLEYATLLGTSTEIVEVQCAVIDVHNNTSNIFTKQITIT